MRVFTAFVTILVWATGCGATVVLAPADPQTVYVTKTDLFNQFVLRCHVQPGDSPAPVCSRVDEVK